MVPIDEKNRNNFFLRADSGQEFLLRTLDKIINQDTVGETGSKRDGVMIIHEEYLAWT